MKNLMKMKESIRASIQQEFLEQLQVIHVMEELVKILKKFLRMMEESLWILKRFFLGTIEMILLINANF